MRSAFAIATLAALTMTATLRAQPLTAPTTRPAITIDPAGTDVIPLWPPGALKDQPSVNTEVITDRTDANGFRDRRVTNVSHPTLTRFTPVGAAPPLTAIIIIPGGGYSVEVFDHEGFFVADRLRSMGYAAFVLRYRLPVGVAPTPGAMPPPIQDVQRAIRLIRARAGEWSIDPQRVGVMGFSAGGHVAGTAATQFDRGDTDATDAVGKRSSRPDFAVLMYAVSSMHADLAHAGSRQQLLGANPAGALEDQFSTAQQVSSETPPLFIVHAKDDNVVKFENSVKVDAAATSAGVPHEFFLYETGGHGFGLASPGTEPFGWLDRFKEWVDELK